MPDFRRLTDGASVSEDDPERGIWYGMCTYWTDDWSKVVRTPIPTCPCCRAPGMQATAADWFGGGEKYQADGHPGYVAFLAQSKEQCRQPQRFMDWFRQWLQEHPNGRDTNPRSAGD